MSDGFAIDLAGQSLLSVWQAAAPYMGQIMAILKHSDINLNITGSREGEKLIGNLEEVREILGGCVLRVQIVKFAYFGIQFPNSAAKPLPHT